jgi:hypothetical protein
VLQRYDDEASASVGTRRGEAISGIEFAHGTVPNEIAELRGLLKANYQLGILNSEYSAALRGGAELHPLH